MKNTVTRKEELAIIIPEYIKTITGETYNTRDLLKIASQQYLETKRNYSLRNGQVKISKKVSKQEHNRFTREDAIWMLDATPDEIAVKFDITVKQAHGFKHYCRHFYKLNSL